ncbi:hypothetical protein H6F95_18625 [Cyanobacteria bacterium FACHB-471]|nr:hypothetical protein [Cyanobacteria bacterium FACHB-471]
MPLKLQPPRHQTSPNLAQPFPWQAYLLMLPAVGIVGLLFGGGLVLAMAAKPSAIFRTVAGGYVLVR